MGCYHIRQILQFVSIWNIPNEDDRPFLLVLHNGLGVDAVIAIISFFILRSR